MSQIDVTTAVPVSQVPGLVPGRPSIATAWRWILEGVRGPDGQQIKLASFKVAGRRFVTRAAINNFISAWSEPPAAPTAPDVSQRRAQEAGNALEKLGA